MVRRLTIGSMALLMIALASGAWAISEGGAIFLMIRPGARAAGMGSAFVAIADDATAIYYNPGGLAFLNRRELALMHSPWLNNIWRDVGDLYYEFAAYVQPVKGWGTVGGSLIFLSEGRSQQTDRDGNVLGEFSSYEMAPHLSYGTKVGRNVGLGGNFKIVYSHLYPGHLDDSPGTGVGTTWAFDFGLLYKGPIKRLSWGVTVQNVGPKLVYLSTPGENGDPLSRNLRVGMAYRLMDSRVSKWVLSADATKMLLNLNDPMRAQLYEVVTHLGTEFVYSDLLALRTGYVTDEAGHIKGPTFGGGVLVKRFSFDYGMEPGGELQKYNQKFSLSVKF